MGVEKNWRVGLVVSGVLLMTAAGYFAARYWQSLQLPYTRLASVAGCDLHAGPCRRPLAGGTLTFAITPREIPLMQPLRLMVEAADPAVRAVAVEIRGLNMDMGLNRTALVQVAPGRWEGETILPVCSRREMSWEAAVRLEADERLEVPFAFRTTRP